MNYYNEIDPHAAEWIRELIADGLMTTQARSEDSAFYQSAHGRLGKEPIPFQAIYSCLNFATARSFRARAYAQRLTLGSLHMIGTHSERCGCTFESESNSTLEAVLISCVVGKQLAEKGSANATHELFSPLSLGGTHQSMSIFGSGLVGLGIASRNAYKHGWLLDAGDVSTDTPPRTFGSKTLLSVSGSRFCHSERMPLLVDPFTHTATP